MKSSILTELASRSSDQAHPDHEIAKKLSIIANDLILDAGNHVKLIVEQNQGFDLHDQLHSSAVLQNMDDLLGKEGINARSVFELFLLTASAHLHDCAMALPQWELNLLKMTEGVSSDSPTKLPGLQNDLKPRLSFDQAKSLITTKEKEMFSSIEECMKWRFSSKDRHVFISDLAERLRAYQEYRNGFSNELRALIADPPAFAKRSESIRQEFVRSTHWQRIEQWCRNLDTWFAEQLGGQWGKALAHDLGSVCRSHGETDQFVRSLPSSVAHHGHTRSDLRLIATLLRIADIIHFTPDRTPLILYRQKLLSSPVSRQHWEVKNEGLDYTVVDDRDGKRTIRYSAYFQTPSLYFLFQDYLDWADHELSLYSVIFQDEATKANGKLPILNRQVDRSGIRHDQKRFEPVPGMKFILNQKRVLDLLMGVRLYKDKFASLRELYQNALDACRCAIAASGDTPHKAVIEFGLAVNEVSKNKYLYCRDSGIGMTKDVVARYLLQIGTSFYKSAEFQQLSTSWDTPFTPTSQFGIGLLACFMIGNRLEITSRPMAGLGGHTSPICFVIDGPHEHFYYREPDATDLEAIGVCGTIVKVYLDDAEAIKIEDSSGLNFPFMTHLDAWSQNWPEFKEAWKSWDAHLYRKVSGFVARPYPGIRTYIRLGDHSCADLIDSTTPFDHRFFGISRELMMLARDAAIRISEEEPPDYLDVIEQAQPYFIEVEYSGLRFSTVVAFPTKGSSLSAKDLRKIKAVSKNEGVLVDGLNVEGATIPYHMQDAEHLEKVGVLNFTGSSRPDLSVDRTQIVGWPADLAFLAKEVTVVFVAELIAIVRRHFETQEINAGDPEAEATWEYVLSRFGCVTGSLIKQMVMQNEQSLVLRELSGITQQDYSVSSFASASAFYIHGYHFHTLSQCTKLLLLGKFAEAERIEFDGKKIEVKSSAFTPLAYQNDWDHFHYRQYCFRADEWPESDFDLISSIWPVVSPRLFDFWVDRHYAEVINQRTKMLESVGNGIGAISKINPRLVHPKLGIYELEDKFRIGRTKPLSAVHKFERATNNFWLWEIQPPSKNDITSPTHRRVLYAFISPQHLSEEDSSTLELYRKEEPDYALGVEQGWSILFLGMSDLNNICRPGKISREFLTSQIPESFWETHSDKEFMFLDGAPVRSQTTDSDSQNKASLLNPCD